MVPVNVDKTEFLPAPHLIPLLNTIEGRDDLRKSVSSISALTGAKHKVSLGIDTARFGNDSSFLWVRLLPDWIIGYVKWSDSSSTLGASIIAGVINELESLGYSVDFVCIDVIGYGAGVCDILLQHESVRISRLIKPINASLASSDKDRYLNARSEFYWNLRTKFVKRELKFFSDLLIKTCGLSSEISVKSTVPSNLGRKVSMQATSLHHKKDDKRGGKYVVENKDEYKKRTTLSSPDELDALAYTFNDSFIGLDYKTLRGNDFSSHVSTAR